MKDQFFKLILVTNKKEKPVNKYLNFIARCAESGITAVQLREKYLSYDELFEFGKQLQTILKPFRVPLIINDHVKLSYELDADGVHLGQSDGNVIEARKRLGKNKIIGLSVNSYQQLYTSNTLSVNYIGIGAIFPTSNKNNLEKIWGLNSLKKVAEFSKHPIVGIGGINEFNVEEVMQSSIQGIAGIGVFHDAKDPCSTIKFLRNIIERNHSC